MKCRKGGECRRITVLRRSADHCDPQRGGLTIKKPRTAHTNQKDAGLYDGNHFKQKAKSIFVEKLKSNAEYLFCYQFVWQLMVPIVSQD